MKLKAKIMICNFRDAANRFVKDVSGASLIEYSVLLGVVLAVAVGAIVLVGNKVNNTFNTVQGVINQ